MVCCPPVTWDIPWLNLGDGHPALGQWPSQLHRSDASEYAAVVFSFPAVRSQQCHQERRKFVGGSSLCLDNWKKRRERKDYYCFEQCRRCSALGQLETREVGTFSLPQRCALACCRFDCTCSSSSSSLQLFIVRKLGDWKSEMNSFVVEINKLDYSMLSATAQESCKLKTQQQRIFSRKSKVLKVNFCSLCSLHSLSWYSENGRWPILILGMDFDDSSLLARL